jgi:hypothetical protein
LTNAAAAPPCFPTQKARTTNTTRRYITPKLMPPAIAADEGEWTPEPAHAAFELLVVSPPVAVELKYHT